MKGTATHVADDIERQAERTDVLRDDGHLKHFNQWRIFRWLRHFRNEPESVATPYKRSHGTASPENALRFQAIGLLFGLSESHATQWPGILVFCRYLESKFEELLNPRFDIIWKLLRRNRPSAGVDCWHWSFAVIKVFQSLKNEDASIEKAYHQMVEEAGFSLDQIEIYEKTQALCAIFAVLCWTSATLEPLLNDEARQIAMDDVGRSDMAQQFALVAKNSSHIYWTRELRRPMSKMFYSFRSHTGVVEQHRQFSSGSTQANGDSSDVLYASSLNYFSLFTIGRVRLKWVDTLTAHLAFDRLTRTLSVYRYPTLCATIISHNQNVKVLTNIANKLLCSNTNMDSPRDPSALHREVLLSYRLLFGQCSRTRKILRHLLTQNVSSTCQDNLTPPYYSSPSFSGSIQDTDPFLTTICTSPLSSRWHHPTLARKPSPHLPGYLFPASALDLNNQLQESDTYLVHDDFPIFGSQLLTLQRYSMRQQPSRVKDLWRDRRNPLQWYTFWAVIWVGGISLVLSLLQNLLAIGQLYFTIQPLQKQESS